MVLQTRASVSVLQRLAALTAMALSASASFWKSPDVDSESSSEPAGENALAARGAIVDGVVDRMDLALEDLLAEGLSGEVFNDSERLRDDPRNVPNVEGTILPLFMRPQNPTHGPIN